MDEGKLTTYQLGHATSFIDDLVKTVKFILHYLTPQEGYFLTPIFINIKVAIFILICFLGANAFNNRPDNLLAWGANYAPLALRGQWWRPVTSLLIEVNAAVLVLNMAALACIGFALEPVLGRARLVIAFLVSGVLGNIAGALLHPVNVGAGSLSAILGLAGIFLMLVLLKFFSWKMNKGAPLFSAIWLICLFLTRIGWFDYIANLGGLIVGLILGLIFYTSLSRSERPLE